LFSVSQNNRSNYRKPQAWEEVHGAMNYRCELESNWRAFVGAELIDTGMVDAIKRSGRSAPMWAREKFHGAQERRAEALYYRANTSGGSPEFQLRRARVHRLSMELSIGRKDKGS